MSKVLRVLFVFFLYISSTYAAEDLKIISRQDWGANEQYRYLDSPEWEAILKSWAEAPTPVLSEAQKQAAKIKADENAKADNFLFTKFLDFIKLESTESYENGHKLAWPIGKVSKIQNIIIHHTDTEYTDSYDAVRNIYKYHAISRQWGDIGYNYLIGYNGEIFEGRAGGDMAVGAHAKWNNRGAIGIAVIGNYHDKPISQAQYNSLEKLTEYLVKKHDINLGLKVPYFRWCTTGDCPNPLDLQYIYPIGGHRDAGHTNCPGDQLYKQIDSIRKKLQKKQFGFDVVDLTKKVESIDDYSILSILVKVEDMLSSNLSNEKRISVEKIKDFLVSFEKNKQNTYMFSESNNYDDFNKIKVKLSYPYTDHIDISTKGKFTPKILEKEGELVIKFLDSPKEQSYDFPFTIKGNSLYLKDHKINDFSENEFVRFDLPEEYYSVISSWDRKPSWDKTGELNDNKFRGDLILYLKDKKLVVVNELVLSDYLKGLGEVSDFENKEKIETIIILARTYARWYMQKDRKFPGEFYDASDDPNVFQKYLGYGLELRSPNINNIVEKTKDTVVTYKNDIIKPWYFSQSTGKTLSFFEYCSKNTKDENYCSREAIKYPFLTSVKDPGGSLEENLGHGVGVPGGGVKYFSERDWSSSMIIKYFLRGTQIKKL